MSYTRVVVTGVSAVTPIGLDAASSWENLLKGVSGIGPITQFDTTEFATTIAGEVTDFDASAYVPPKSLRRMERFTQFAVVSSMMLLEDAGLEITDDNAERVGCIIGCGLGGLEALERSHTTLLKSGPRRVSPFMIPTLISNMAPGMASIFT
ncbi:MAG: beta-ketoacyl-[acyl-carrier-protein] synthase II, partial [Desulfovibrio sp.]